MLIKEKIEKFFNEVMSDLNLPGWKLRWMDGDAFCWRHSKQIDICLMYSYSSCAQMLLHEIAHINNYGNGHREIFLIDMIKLIKKYLNEDPDKYQLDWIRREAPHLEIKRSNNEV